MSCDPVTPNQYHIVLLNWTHKTPLFLWYFSGWNWTKYQSNIQPTTNFTAVHYGKSLEVWFPNKIGRLSIVFQINLGSFLIIKNKLQNDSTPTPSVIESLKRSVIGLWKPDVVSKYQFLIMKFQNILILFEKHSEGVCYNSEVKSDWRN